jgi:DNA-binding transcriptional LysR family regulator
MLFRQLEYFVAVAREKHFARAAEACYVSQPALSAAIARLERELNVTLINRGHNFEGLTPEGERLVLWAKKLLAEHDAFKAEAAAMRSGIASTLRLGTGPTVSATAGLPVAAFCAMHPLARVQVSGRLPPAECCRRLRDFRLDVAIGNFAPEDTDGLEVVPLYEERYMLIVSREQMASPPASMTWAEAAQLPLALLTPDMRFRQLADCLLGAHRGAPAPQVETDSLACLYALVATGTWASVVPHTWLRELPGTARLRAIRLTEPDSRTQISIAINTAGPGAVAAKTFLTVATGLLADQPDHLPAGRADHLAAGRPDQTPAPPERTRT